MFTLAGWLRRNISSSRRAWVSTNWSFGGSSFIAVLPFPVCVGVSCCPHPLGWKVRYIGTQHRAALVAPSKAGPARYYHRLSPAQTRPTIRISTSRNLCQASITRCIPVLASARLLEPYNFVFRGALHHRHARSTSHRPPAFSSTADRPLV